MFIYVLKEPDTDLVCYVGRTNNPKKRFNAHKNPSYSANLPVMRWVRNLKDNGKLPVMEIIEETNDWENCEKKWIQHYRYINLNLLNIDDGGIVNVYTHKDSGAGKSKKFMSVILTLTYGTKISISPEVKEFWKTIRKGVTETRRWVYSEFGKDGVEYFDDCIYSEFIERKPKSFRILA